MPLAENPRDPSKKLKPTLGTDDLDRIAKHTTLGFKSVISTPREGQIPLKSTGLDRWVEEGDSAMGLVCST